MKVNYDKLFKAIGYQFSNLDFIKQALRHRSLGQNNNERLEFLGDSVLNFVISAELFRLYPKVTEGELSRLRAHLVCGESLALIGQEFPLSDYMKMGQGELKSGGFNRKSTTADAVEAIIGAIYLDSGIEACRSCILTWFNRRLENICLQSLKDAKTQLQEHLQQHKLPLPIYEVETIEGEAHKQIFHVLCIVKGFEFSATGSGRSRRKAEQIAAKLFLEKLINE